MRLRGPLDQGRARLVGGAANRKRRGKTVRNGRWREVEVRHHEREDGAAVRHVPLPDAGERALGWIGLGPAPDRAPLTDRRGRHKRFGTPEAAKAAVDWAWP
jgi:hypothetical protein